MALALKLRLRVKVTDLLQEFFCLPVDAAEAERATERPFSWRGMEGGTRAESPKWNEEKSQTRPPQLCAFHLELHAYLARSVVVHFVLAFD